MPSLYTHEQLKSYKSLDGYNQYMNGWVSDIVSTVSTANGCKVYLFTAFVKRSQSISLPSLKTWAAIKQYWVKLYVFTAHVWRALVRHAPILQLYLP